MWLNNWFPMFSGKADSKKLAKYENNLEWQNTFVRLVNTCLDQFEWTGLPDSCNSRFIEQALLFEGKFALVNDPDYGFLSLRATPNNVYNIYGEFDRVHVYGYNGYSRDFDLWVDGGDNKNSKAVLCRDNDCGYPYYLYIIMATDRMSQAMRSIDVASYQLKHPYFIQCEESQKLSIERILSDVGNNKPAIITTKAVSPDDFKVVQTGANPAVLQQMWDNYYKHENNVKQILGINNNSMPDKSERLLVDEVNANDEQTAINIDIRLKERQHFCEIANKLFGLNISVDVKHNQKSDMEVLSDDVERTGTDDDLQEMERDE